MLMYVFTPAPFVFSTDAPSIEMLFPVVREPSTLNVVFPEKPCVSAPGLSTTPGINETSDAKSRLITVKLSISLAVMIPDRSPLAVCTVAPADSTVTVWFTSPTSNTIVPTETASLAVTVTLPRRWVLKPGCSAARTYTPVATLGNPKRPSASLIAARVAPVVSEMSRRATPPTAAPLLSTSVPTTEPAMTCPHNAAGRHATIPNPHIRNIGSRIAKLT